MFNLHRYNPMLKPMASTELGRRSVFCLPMLANVFAGLDGAWVIQDQRSVIKFVATSEQVSCRYRKRMFTDP